MLKTSIIGHLGMDATIKEFNGNKVINFSVAHTESFKNADGTKVERTTWVNCSYWSERTAVAQYLTKGTQVYVEGQPSVDAFLNRDNKPAAVLRLRVNHIQLLGSSNRQEQTQHAQPAPAAVSNEAANEGPDDLPF